MGGLGHPSARITLVGSRSPQSWPNFSKDPDPIIFSEIVEFALSLTSISKGQDAFTGIIHLQAYRFMRAMALAEIGDIQQANRFASFPVCLQLALTVSNGRYCDAITTVINRSSPYVTPGLLEQLKGLIDRIAGVTQVDKSFWTGAKMPKASLDTISDWFFTKLAPGDSETEQTQDNMVTKPDSREFSGPFSHYSTISSTTPSARSSPQPSVVNYNVLPPARTGSALAISSFIAPPVQIDRASSAMEYVRRKPSPGPRIVSANASTTTFANSPSLGQVLANQKLHSGYSSPNEDLVTPRPSVTSDEEEPTNHQATWWGSSAYDESNAMQTPTAATFMPVDENAVTESSNGFISLMDTPSYSYPTSPQVGNGSHNSHFDEEEDLGFGNSKPKPKPQPTREERRESQPPSPGAEPVTADPPKQPGKIIVILFNRECSTDILKIIHLLLQQEVLGSVVYGRKVTRQDQSKPASAKSQHFTLTKA